MFRSFIFLHVDPTGLFRRYAFIHIHRDGILWRYLSRTALTIWLSNAWNKDDLMAELVRLRRAGYSPK